MGSNGTNGMGENTQQHRMDVCERFRHSLPDDVLVHRVDGGCGPAGHGRRGSEKKSHRNLSAQIFPWAWTGMVLAIISGFFMFLTDAGDWAPDPVFHVKLGMIVLSIVFAILVQRGAPKWGALAGNTELGKSHRRNCIVAVDSDDSERVGNSRDGRLGIANPQCRGRDAGNRHSRLLKKRGQPDMYGLLQTFAKWLEGTPWGVGVRTSLWAYPFTQLVHFTGLSIWLGTNLALDLRLLGLGKQPRNGGAASGRFVRLELDRLLHCRARRFSSVFLDRDDVSGQRRVSLEAGRFLFRWLCSGTSSCNGKRATGERRRTLRPSQNFRALRKFCFGFA